MKKIASVLLAVAVCGVMASGCVWKIRETSALTSSETTESSEEMTTESNVSSLDETDPAEETTPGQQNFKGDNESTHELEDPITPKESKKQSANETMSKEEVYNEVVRELEGLGLSKKEAEQFLEDLEIDWDELEIPEDFDFSMDGVGFDPNTDVTLSFDNIEVQDIDGMETYDWDSDQDSEEWKAIESVFYDYYGDFDIDEYMNGFEFDTGNGEGGFTIETFVVTDP